MPYGNSEADVSLRRWVSVVSCKTEIVGKSAVRHHFFCQ